MLIKLLKFLFGKLIGSLTPEQKREFWEKFNILISEATKAAVAGAIEGATKK